MVPTLPLDPFPEGHGAASLPSPAFLFPPFSQPFHTLWLFPSGRSQTALMELRSPGHIGRAFKNLHSLDLIPLVAIKCAQTKQRRIPSPSILCKWLLWEAGGATVYQLCYEVGAHWACTRSH